MESNTITRQAKDFYFKTTVQYLIKNQMCHSFISQGKGWFSGIQSIIRKLSYSHAHYYGHSKVTTIPTIKTKYFF